MKRTLVPLAVFSAIAIILAACATRAPSAFEVAHFNIVTNPPVISITTNVIPVTLYKTNEVVQTVTNVQGVTEYRTNVVPVAVPGFQTNVAVVTNEPQSYHFTPKPEAIQPYKDAAGAAGNLFGVGGLASTAVGIFFSVWGFLRSRKNYSTAADLAQIIETMRSFVQQLPNGAAYDTALVSFMQAHQAESGVINQVIQLLTKEVSNPDAQVAADHIRQGLIALGVTLPPPTTVNK